MKVVNDSNTPWKRLQPLLRFALKSTRYSGLGVLRVSEAGAGRSTIGKAVKLDQNPETYEPATPSVVKLMLRGEGTLGFPYWSRYAGKSTEIEVRSWEEEVLLVLAHELRHLDQFWCLDQQKYDDNVFLSELDAETFAINVLKQYRRTKKGSLK